MRMQKNVWLQMKIRAWKEGKEGKQGKEKKEGRKEGKEGGTFYVMKEPGLEWECEEVRESIQCSYEAVGWRRAL